MYLSFAVMTDQEALEDSGRKVAENIQFEDSRTTALQQKLSVYTPSDATLTCGRL